LTDETDGTPNGHCANDEYFEDEYLDILAMPITMSWHFEF